MRIVPVEADRVLVLDHHVEEPSELIEFTAHVGVEQRVVALTPAPQHVVLAAESLGGGHAVRDLCSGVLEQLGIGVGRGARLEPWVREQVGGAPQQAHAGALLMGGGQFHHLVEVAARLGEGRALGRDVTVVEAVERRAELGEEFEGDLHLLLRGGHGVAAWFEPRTVEGAGAEDVDALGVERVPVGRPRSGGGRPWCGRRPRGRRRTSGRRAGCRTRALRSGSCRCRRRSRWSWSDASCQSVRSGSSSRIFVDKYDK